MRLDELPNRFDTCGASWIDRSEGAWLVYVDFGHKSIENCRFKGLHRDLNKAIDLAVMTADRYFQFDEEPSPIATE